MSSMGAASGAIRTIRSVFRGLTRVTSGERWAPSHSGTIALETWPELAELPAVQLILHPGHGYIMGILTWVILICIWYVYMWMFTFHTFLICWLNDLLYDLLCISVSHCVTTDCGLASCKCKPCRFDTWCQQHDVEFKQLRRRYLDKPCSQRSLPTKA